MTEKKRDSVVIFRSVYEATKGLDGEDRDKIMQKLLAYCFDGVEPKKLNPIENMVFVLAKPTIDRSIERYETCVKNGKKGGRPRKKKQESDEIASESDEEAKAKCLKETEEMQNASLSESLKAPAKEDDEDEKEEAYVSACTYGTLTQKEPLSSDEETIRVVSQYVKDKDLLDRLEQIRQNHLQDSAGDFFGRV